MIKELFQPDLLLIISNGKIRDYVDFFASMFERQETFDGKYVDIKYFGKYTPDRNSGSIKTRSFEQNAASWLEFQNWLDTAYTLAKPIALLSSQYAAGNITQTDALSYLTDISVYNRPVVGGLFSQITTTFLVASNGTIIATGLVTDLQWETAYNSLLIPYERSINSTIAPGLKYIKNLQQYGDYATFFRTSSLKFDGTGY